MGNRGAKRTETWKAASVAQAHSLHPGAVILGAVRQQRRVKTERLVSSLRECLSMPEGVVPRAWLA